MGKEIKKPRANMAALIWTKPHDAANVCDHLMFRYSIQGTDENRSPISGLSKRRRCGMDDGVMFCYSFLRSKL